MSWLSNFTDADYDALYDKFDPLNPDRDEYGDLWRERERQIRGLGLPYADHVQKTFDRLGSLHTGIAGDEGAASKFFWEEGDFYEKWPSLEGTGAQLQKEDADYRELYSALFGDKDDQWEARRDRKAYHEAYDETVADVNRRMANPEIAQAWSDAGGMLSVELPFLAASGGAANLARWGAKTGLKKGLKRAGREFAEEAGERLANRYGNRYAKRAAIGTMMGIHGARSGAGNFASAVDTYAEGKFGSLRENNPDLTDEQVWDLAYSESQDEALVPAVIGGALTAGLVGAFGLTGAEALLASKGGAKTLGDWIKSMFVHSQLEGLEETADAFGQGIIQMQTYNPNKKWEDVVDDMVHAYGMGALMGGVYTGVGGAVKPIASKLESIPFVKKRVELGKAKRARADLIKTIKSSILEINPDISKEELNQKAEAGADGMIAAVEGGLKEAATGGLKEADETAPIPVIQDEESEVFEPVEAATSQTAEDFDEFGVFQGTSTQGEQQGPVAETEEERLERYTAEELERSLKEPMPVNEQTEGMDAKDYALLVAKNRATKRIKDERIVAEAARRKDHPRAAEFKALEEEAEGEVRELTEEEIEWDKVQRVNTPEAHKAAIKSRLAPYDALHQIAGHYTDAESQSHAEEIIKAYVDSGADVNDADGSGRTPLHRAADSGNINIVKALLAAGANASAETEYGRTPLYVAEQEAGYLREHISDESRLQDKDENLKAYLEAKAKGTEEVIAALKEAVGIKGEPEPVPAIAPETTAVPPTAPTTLEEDIDSVWDDVFPTLIEKYGKENLGIFNKERIAGVVGRLRAAEEAGDVAGMNKELSKLIGVIPRDMNDSAQMTRVEDVIQKEADRLLGGLEDSVLLDFIRKKKKQIGDAGRDWRDSIVKSKGGSMMEEGEPAPVFSEALKRGLIDESGNETAAPPATPTAAPESEAVPTPTSPSSETHYVLSAVTGRTQTKAEGKKDIVKEKREAEVGGYKTEVEHDLGYPFTLKNNDQRPAILKYTIQKKIAVGYYQGTSTSGNPIFHTIFELDPKAAGVEVFTNEKGKVTGVHVPKELASQLAILKSEASKTDTNWKITNSRKGKLAARTVDESVTSDEKTDEIIDAVTNSSLKKLLKKLAVNNLVSAASIRALINTADVKGRDGKKVNAATVVDPKKLATYLTRAIESYKWVSKGTKTTVSPDGGTVTVDESGARRYAALVGEKIDGKGVRKEYVEQLTKEAKSLTSSKRADQDTRNSAISRMLTAAHEKAEADKTFTQYDEGAGNQRISKYGEDFDESRKAEGLENLQDQDYEIDQSRQEKQDRADKKTRDIQEGGVSQGETGSRGTDERVDDAFASKTADSLENLAATSEQGRKALAMLDALNVNPETMTEEDKAKAMRFAEAVHSEPETFYRNLYAIKSLLAGSLKVKTRPIATTIPNLPAAKGKQSIRDLILNPANGMTKEERKLNLAFVDHMAPETLALLTFQITGSLDLDGNDSVQYEGTFNAITKIAKMMYGKKVDPSVMAEEIAHFTATLLPEGYRKAARKIHAAAFKRLENQVDSQLKKATDKDEVAMLNAARDVIIEAKKKGGSLSTHDANRLIQAAAAKHGITMNAIPVPEESLYGDSIVGSARTPTDERAGTLEGVAEIIKDGVSPMLNYTENLLKWRELLTDSDPNTDNGFTDEQRRAAEQELYRQLNRDENVSGHLNDGKGFGEINSREVAEEAISAYDTFSEQRDESHVHQLSKDLGITEDEAGDIAGSINLFAGRSDSAIDKQVQEHAVKYFGGEVAGGIAAYETGPMGQRKTENVFIKNNLMDSPNFAPWFGESVMMIDGKPMVMFHATTFEGSIDHFNELAGYEDRLRKELGLRDDQDIPASERHKLDIDNRRRIGHFFAPDPAFSPYMFGHPPAGTKMYAELQKTLESETHAGVLELTKNTFQTDLHTYPVFIRAENPFDSSSAQNRKTLMEAVAEAEADAKYLLGEVDPTKAWSDDVRVMDVLNYQRKPDVKQLEEDGWTEEEIANEVETHNEESAKIKAALERLSNGFEVKKVKHLNQIVEAANESRRAVTEGYTKGKSLQANNWDIVEKFTRFIKYAGFDSYFVMEHDRKNIAVFDTNQVKSSVSNNGEFSLDPSSAISGSLSDTEAKNLNKLIELVYPVINPDEFYARGLVKHNTQSVYRKGLEIALDILGAILNNPAIKVDSVRERAERRKFFKEVSRMLKTGKGLDFNRAARPGGLLLRDAINSGSIEAIKSAKILGTHIAKIDQQIKGREAAKQDTSKLREARELLLGEAAASTHNLTGIIDKYIPAGLSPKVNRLLRRNVSDDISKAATATLLPEEYQAQYNLLKDGKNRPELAAALANTALAFYKNLQYRYDYILLNYQQFAAELNSPQVKVMFKDAADAFDKVVMERDLERAVQAQFRIALNAIAATGTDVRATNILAGAVEGDGAVLRDGQQDKANIKGKAKEIARTLSKSATGSDLLVANPSATSADVLKLADRILVQYGLNRSLNPKAPPLPKEGTLSHSRWRLAAALLAANHSLKENALAVVFAEDGELDAAGLQKFANDLIRGVENSKPEEKAKAINKAVKLVTNYTKKAERQRLVFQKHYKEVSGKLERVQTYYEAAKIIEKVLADPELKKYVALLNKHTKAIETPTFKVARKGRTVLVDGVMPDRYERNELMIPVPAYGDKPAKLIIASILSDEEGEANLARMREAYDTITNWLMDNDIEHEYYEYYSQWHKMLENVYLSELVVHPKQNVRSFAAKQSLSVLEQTLNNIPGRSVEVAKQLVRKHSLYFVKMGAWASKYGDAWKNRMTAAVKSHKADGAEFDTSLKGLSREETFKNWELFVGNELRASHQEGGRNLDVGDTLMTQAIVTEQDMALLKFEGKITDEAYRINQNIAAVDSSMSPDYIKERQGKHIVRLPLAKGKTFLPRVFSTRAREFLQGWRIIKKRDAAVYTDSSNFDELFSGLDEALFSFIVDRNPTFTVASELEEYYNSVAQKVADGSIDRDVQSIVDELAKLSGKGKGDIKSLILSEYKPILDSLERLILDSEEGRPTQTTTSFEAEGPFAKARAADIAPYYFYQYGFLTSVDLKKFSLLGSGKPLENVILGLKSVQDEFETLERKVTQRRKRLIASGDYKRGSVALEVRLAKEFKLQSTRGKHYMPTKDEIAYWKDKLSGVIENFERAYSMGSAGAREDFMPNLGVRIASGLIGLTLMSGGTLIRNDTDASVIGGVQLSFAQGQTGASAFLKGLFLRMPTGAMKLAASGAASAVKLATGVDTQLTTSKGGVRKFSPKFSWSRPDLIFKSFPRMLDAFINARGIHKVIAPVEGFLSPAMSELTYNLPMRIHEVRMLAEHGLDMPVTPDETTEAFYGDLSTGGRGVSEFDSDNKNWQASGRSLRAAMGQGEALLALVGKTVFPRMGDIGGNIQLVDLGLSFVNNLESMLRKAYAARVHYEESLAEDISEEELLGRYLGVFRANKASFNETLRMLARGGVTNFQKEAKLFFQRLEGSDGGKNYPLKSVRFLDPNQRQAIAMGYVTQSNAATPSNRPAWTRLQATNNMLLALMGWGTNAIQVVGNSTFLLSKSRKRTGYDTAQQNFAAIIWLLGFLASTIPTALLAKFLYDIWTKVVFGLDPSTGYPHDKSSIADRFNAYLGTAFSSVPLVGSFIQTAIHGQPARGTIAPGNLMSSKAGAIAEYLAYTAKTGDPTRRFQELREKLAPITRVVDQFNEDGLGDIAFSDAMSGLAKHWPSGEVAIYKGMTLAARIANIKDIDEPKKGWRLSLARGNQEGAKEYYEIMKDIIIEGDESLSRKRLSDRVEAEKRLNSSLRNSNPIGWKLNVGTTKSNFMKQTAKLKKDDRERWDRMMAVINSFDLFYKNKQISASGIWEPEEAEPLPKFRVGNPNKRERLEKRPIRGAYPKFYEE